MLFFYVLLVLEALDLGVGLRRPVEHHLDVLVAVRQRGGAVGLGQGIRVVGLEPIDGATCVFLLYLG